MKRFVISVLSVSDIQVSPSVELTDSEKLSKWWKKINYLKLIQIQVYQPEKRRFLNEKEISSYEERNWNIFLE